MDVFTVPGERQHGVVPLPDLVEERSPDGHEGGEDGIQLRVEGANEPGGDLVIEGRVRPEAAPVAANSTQLT